MSSNDQTPKKRAVGASDDTTTPFCKEIDAEFERTVGYLRLQGAGAKSAVFRGLDVAYGFMCGEKDDMEDMLREARRMVEKAGQLGDGWFAWKFVRVHEEFFNFGGEDPEKELGNQPKENGQQVQKWFCEDANANRLDTHLIIIHTRFR